MQLKKFSLIAHSAKALFPAKFMISSHNIPQKHSIKGDEEMAQQIRVHIALAEDPSSIPSTQVTHNHL